MAAARRRGRRYDAKGPEEGRLHLPRSDAPTAGYQGLVMLCGCRERPGWKPAYWSLGDAVSRQCARCARSRAKALRGSRRGGPAGEQLALPIGS